MSIGLAIALTLIASTCMNLGMVLQKKGVSSPGWQLSRFYLSPGWCWGMALLLGGYALYVLANSVRAAPISLLQPIFAFGLLVVAFMAVVYLKERFGVLEWLGVSYFWPAWCSWAPAPKNPAAKAPPLVCRSCRSTWAAQPSWL
jgi:drug/metabolite transporter (DMT)-like permease